MTTTAGWCFYEKKFEFLQQKVFGARKLSLQKCHRQLADESKKRIANFFNKRVWGLKIEFAKVSTTVGLIPKKPRSRSSIPADNNEKVSKHDFKIDGMTKSYGFIESLFGSDVRVREINIIIQANQVPSILALGSLVKTILMYSPVQVFAPQFRIVPLQQDTNVVLVASSRNKR